MFIRTKRGGSPNAPRDYLQIVEGYREGNRVKQRVVANLGRLDELIRSGSVDGLLKSLSRFSKRLKVIEAARAPEVDKCKAKMWGPVLVFRRLWQEQGLPQILGKLADKRRIRFDVEQVVFALALQRLVAPGSDLQGERWMRRVFGLEGIGLHHLYRTCTFLSENKERIERELFLRERTLFDSTVDLVFFDTTSSYFEGGESPLRKYGFSKDHRPDRVQIVVGVVMSREGWPLACEIYPGNQVDLKAVAPLIRLVKKRFELRRVILVVDRGFVSPKTLEAFEGAGLEYIVGTRLRRYKEVREKVLRRAGRYMKIAENLQVKEVTVEGSRYVVCLNPEEAIKDAHDRMGILKALEKKLSESGPRSLLGNKGFARYLRMERDSVKIDPGKVKSEARFDGKYVLQTNTTLPVDEVALAYKSLWQVERAFRELKSTLDVRPVFHRTDANVIGHVFGAFLGLRLEIALQKRLAKAGWKLPWKDLMGDLQALTAVRVALDGKEYIIRSDLEGDCYKAFQAVGIRPPSRVQSAEVCCAIS